jgi:hypothetical protein
VAVAHDYRVPHSAFLRWSKDDRDKAIWHYLRERDRCPHCGTRSQEWAADAGAYVAALRWCKGCATMQRRQKQMDEGGGPKLPGLYVTLQRPQPAELEPTSAPAAVTVPAVAATSGVVIVG